MHHLSSYPKCPSVRECSVSFRKAKIPFPEYVHGTKAPPSTRSATRIRQWTRNSGASCTLSVTGTEVPSSSTPTRASSTNTWTLPTPHPLRARLLQEAFREEPKGVATYVMAIVHEAAAYLPEFVGYLGERQGDLVVKSGHLLRKAEVQTTMLLNLLERCPFLALTLPWGPLCSLGLAHAQRERRWSHPVGCWPGEQMIPTGELGPTPKKKRNTGAAELQSLYGSRTNERRETLFEDRTHCHADHVVFGSKRETTAAVGVLIGCGVL
eukprot:Em0518g1a